MAKKGAIEGGVYRGKDGHGSIVDVQEVVRGDGREGMIFTGEASTEEAANSMVHIVQGLVNEVYGDDAEVNSDVFPKQRSDSKSTHAVNWESTEGTIWEERKRARRGQANNN